MLMDNFDNQAPIQPSPADLRTEFDSLRQLVVSLLTLVFVLSGTLNLYLLRQYRSLSKELTEKAPQLERLALEYQRSVPFMTNVVAKLTEYGRTHPDYVPYLAKYGFKPAGATSPAPAGPSSLTPASPTSPKK
jgi:hypothetical protein